MTPLIRIAAWLRKSYWFVFRPRTSGVKALVVKDGRVLLVKNTYGDQLLLPGGGMDKGESPEQAIRRELREEAGVLPNKLRLMGEYLSVREHKRDTIFLFYVDDFTTEASRSMEIRSCGYYDPHALPKDVSASTLQRLKADPQGFERGAW